jgi:hypothetical protein
MQPKLRKVAIMFCTWNERSLCKPDSVIIVASNIKLILREIGCGDMGWIYLVWDRNQWSALESTVMNIQNP